MKKRARCAAGGSAARLRLEAVFLREGQQPLPVPPVASVEAAIARTPLQLEARVVAMFQAHLLQRVEVVRQPRRSAATAEQSRKWQKSLLKCRTMQGGSASNIGNLSDSPHPVRTVLHVKSCRRGTIFGDFPPIAA